ncbi:MAG: hypothetical protein AAGI68_11610 [Planctomycetota bacterium]
MNDASGKKPTKAKKKWPEEGRQEVNDEVASMLTNWIGTYPRLRPAFEQVLQMSAEHGPKGQEVSDAWERFNRIHERESKRGTPAAIEMPLTSDSDPRASMPECTSRHAGDLTGMIYDDLIRQCVGNKIGRDHGVFHKIASITVLHARDALQRTNSADPMEEMLVGQSLLTHARVLRLNHLMAKATEMNQVKVLGEAAGRASNTFRRQMAALDEHRCPRATPYFN